VSTPRPVLLDCDPGHDDAIAIMLAVSDPGIDLRAVTTVAGNSTLANTTRNALRVLDLVGRPDIPVAAGRAAPLIRDLSTAAIMHGEGGLDGPLPTEPSRPSLDVPAIELIEQVLTEATEPVTLVATGPLTNMADVVQRLPHLRDSIRELVIMGGAVDLGNWTPAAEFNIWVDPHAADIVFRAACAPGADRGESRHIPLTMIGLEVTHKAWLTDEHADVLRHTGHTGLFVAELLDHFVGFHQRRFGWEGGPIHDAVTIAHLIDPTLVTVLPMNVEIETESALCLGRTVADRWAVTDREPNAAVGLDIDRNRFVTMLLEHVSSLP
jgi:pyrimidine-specific ribonucleoside hydrolase